MKLAEIMLHQMPGDSNPKKFMIMLMELMVNVYGRLTWNMSRYSHCSEKTFSLNYRQTFSFAEFNQLLVRQREDEGNGLIAAFDPAFIPKSGTAICGERFLLEWHG